MSEKTLLLIDTNNMGFMAFGRAPLKYKGVRTEVLSIGLAMLRRYLTKFNPSDVRLVYDGGRDTHRTSVYPEYKRRPRLALTPMEIRERRCFFRQLRIFDVNMFRLGFTHVRCRGREADDVIYSLVRQAIDDKNFEQIVVVSSDRDFFQLFQHFGNKVSVFHPIKDILYTEALVEKEFGVPAEWYLSYRAMVGDPGDNLPGVKGLGSAKAKKIVEVLTQADDGGSLSVADQKLLLFLSENEKAFELMRFLLSFQYVDKEEILAGTSKVNPGPVELRETFLLEICQHYGLEKILENFESTASPFCQYWRQEGSR